MNVYTELLKGLDSPSLPLVDADEAVRKSVDMQLLSEARILDKESNTHFKDGAINLSKSARMNAFVVGYMIMFPAWAAGYLKLSDKEAKMLTKANKDMNELVNRIFTSSKPQRPNLVVKLYNHANQF